MSPLGSPATPQTACVCPRSTAVVSPLLHTRTVYCFCFCFCFFFKKRTIPTQARENLVPRSADDVAGAGEGEGDDGLFVAHVHQLCLSRHSVPHNDGLVVSASHHTSAVALQHRTHKVRVPTQSQSANPPCSSFVVCFFQKKKKKKNFFSSFFFLVLHTFCRVSSPNADCVVSAGRGNVSRTKRTNSTHISVVADEFCRQNILVQL